MSQGKNLTQNNKINNLPSERKTTTTMYNGEGKPKVQKVKSSDPVHSKLSVWLQWTNLNSNNIINLQTRKGMDYSYTGGKNVAVTKLNQMLATVEG